MNPKLNWTKTSDYSIATQCGYHIARAVIDGKDSFQLWHHRHILGCSDTAAEAKEKAEAHKQGKAE